MDPQGKIRVLYYRTGEVEAGQAETIDVRYSNTTSGRLGFCSKGSRCAWRKQLESRTDTGMHRLSVNVERTESGEPGMCGE